MKSLSIALSLCFIATLNLYAQKRRNITFSPIIQKFESGGSLINNREHMVDLRVPIIWIPWVTHRPELNNYRIGGNMTVFNKNLPLDINFALTWTNRAYEIRTRREKNWLGIFPAIEDKVNATKHSIFSVTPSIELRYKLGDYVADKYFKYLVLGMSYDYNYAYKQKQGIYKPFRALFKYPEVVSYSRNNIVEGGYSIQLGYGINGRGSQENDTQGFIVTRTFFYQLQLYNVFNRNYEINGMKPYKNWRTYIGFIGAKWTFKIPQWAKDEIKDAIRG